MLAAVAEVMLPGSGVAPSAAAVGVAGELTDAVLASRPDLIEPLGRALDAIAHDAPSLARLDRLCGDDEPGYTALTTVVAGAYYQSPQARAAIGYPGQVARTYDPYAYVQWVEEGLLDPVIARGPIHRPVPEEVDR